MTEIPIWVLVVMPVACFGLGAVTVLLVAAGTSERARRRRSRRVDVAMAEYLENVQDLRQEAEELVERSQTGG